MFRRRVINFVLKNFIPAQPYYVSTSGSDAGIGTIGAPWLTPAYAVAHVPAGATIYLRGGTYTTSSARMVITQKQIIMAYPNETPILDGTGVSMPSTGYQGGIDIKGTSGTHINGVTVKGITVQNWGDGSHQHVGIHVEYADNVDIESCTTHTTTDSGIFCTHCISGTILYNSVNDHNQGTADMDEGMSFADVTLFTINHNTVNNSVSGKPYVNASICVKTSSSFCTIAYNTVGETASPHSLRGAILIDAWTSALHDVTVMNNYIHDCQGGISLDAEGPAGAGHLYNVWCYNNIVYNFSVLGIGLDQVGDGLRDHLYIWNNTCVKHTDSGGAGIWFKTSNIASPIEVKNNLVDVEEGTNGQIRIPVAVQSLCTISNNNVWGVNSYSGSDEIPSGETWANPLIENRTDPTITATFLQLYASSPCKNTAVSEAGTFTIDYDGSTRSTWDIGARDVSNTPAPTPNIIFHAGINTDLSEFTTITGTGLSADAAAAMRSTAKGLKVVISDTSARYGDKSGLNSTTGILGSYIWINPNSLTMNNGDNFGFWSAKTAAGNTVFFLLLDKNGANYQVQLGHYDNTGTAHYDTNAVINNAANYIEFQAVRSGSGLSNGTIAYKVNGVSQTGVTSIANDTRWAQIDLVRLGAGTVIAVPATTSGTLYLDEEIIYDNNVAWEGA